MYDSPGPHLPFTNTTRDFKPIEIHDLRPVLGSKEISTETTGFDVVPRELSQTKMKLEDWNDETKILEVYYPEVEEMLKKHLGASKVIFFDYTVRKGEKEGEETPDTPSSRKPVPLDTSLDFPFFFFDLTASCSSTALHVDQTAFTGERRVRRHGGDDADRLLRGAFSFPFLSPSHFPPPQC
jgi:hypothetical protein